MSYDKEELKELIRIHVENPDAQLESGLTAEDGAILRGALDYKVCGPPPPTPGYIHLPPAAVGSSLLRAPLPVCAEHRRRRLQMS